MLPFEINRAIPLSKLSKSKDGTALFAPLADNAFLFERRYIMKIFLIAGKSGSGKTEAAYIIKDALSKTVVTNLSKYIKIFALEMTEWDGDDHNKPRTFLQHMGDKLREIDKNFLTKRLLEDTEIYKQYYDNIVVCDIRLKEEIEYIKNNTNNEVITILVKSNRLNDKLTDEEHNHKTENEFLEYDKYDYIVENNYDDNFKKEIDKIIERVK